MLLVWDKDAQIWLPAVEIWLLFIGVESKSCVMSINIIYSDGKCQNIEVNMEIRDK